MRPPHLDDPGLEDRRQLVRTVAGLGAPVLQGAKPLVGVADQPTVQGSAVDPIAGGHVGHGRSGVEHLAHGEIALLNHRKHRQHDRLLGSAYT